MRELSEPFYQVPKSIFKLWVQGKLKDSTIKLYIVFFERYKISKFKDENNEKYFTFTYKQIMKELNIGNELTIRRAILELEENDLIKKKGVTRQSNRYYIL